MIVCINLQEEDKFLGASVELTRERRVGTCRGLRTTKIFEVYRLAWQRVWSQNGRQIS